MDGWVQLLGWPRGSSLCPRTAGPDDHSGHTGDMSSVLVYLGMCLCHTCDIADMSLVFTYLGMCVTCVAYPAIHVAWHMYSGTYASQPHIGQFIQAQRHSLFGHVVRLHSSVPCNAILRLTRDISMSRRIPPGWRRPRGRPRPSWTSQLKKDTGTATSWRRAVDRLQWRKDATALTGYVLWWCYLKSTLPPRHLLSTSPLPIKYLVKPVIYKVIYLSPAILNLTLPPRHCTCCTPPSILYASLNW